MSWGSKKDKDDDTHTPLPFEPHRHTEDSRTPTEKDGKIISWNIWCECGIVFRTVRG